MASEHTEYVNCLRFGNELEGRKCGKSTRFLSFNTGHRRVLRSCISTLGEDTSDMFSHVTKGVITVKPLGNSNRTCWNHLEFSKGSSLVPMDRAEQDRNHVCIALVMALDGSFHFSAVAIV